MTKNSFVILIDIDNAIQLHQMVIKIDFDVLYDLALETAESHVNKQEIAAIFMSCMKRI
jgi:hypothetical protein